MTAFVLFLGAIVAQATAFQYLKEYGIAFDSVLAIAIVLGFMRGNYQQLMIPAFFAGIILDSMSGAPFGTITTALMAALAALSVLSTTFAREHVIHFAVFAVVGSVLFSAIVFFITMLLDPYARMPIIGVLSIIGYNSAGTILIYLFSRWIILSKNRISGR